MHGAAWNSLASHRYDEAVERCLKGLENDPHHFLLRVWLGIAYATQAKYPEAIRELQAAVDLSSRAVSWVIGALGHAYAVAGNRPEALAILEELLGRAERGTIDFTSIAVIYAGLGDTDNALLYLEKGCDARGMSGVLLKPDPRLDLLRSEPRYQNLLRQMNLV
jgi:tetratricopeptide (TPR) repeat protein